MHETFHQHIPVLLMEAVEGLVISPDGIYIDATFGRGSHSQAILNKLSEKGRLIAFDKDPDAVDYAQHHIADKRFTILHRSFSQLKNSLCEIQISDNIHGILFDLGVSSPQLDTPERGFSFARTGLLDMRMDTTQGKTAMQWLTTIEEKDLANILWEYGEERYSRRIAHAIALARKESPIKTTTELASIIKRAIPKTKQTHDKHPATRSFQAIRIFINQELVELRDALMQAQEVLKIGGRLSVISFHSLEDRIVKQFIKQHEKKQDLPRGLPIKNHIFNPKLRTIGKPIKPSLAEITSNPRARSAILRIAEKLS
ncbi:MAG: 16S rRNA (cytosine(1402)-N(4))-methyltransferase [Gammaproteobacteria bacterium RIFCSPHIGHO2_12_FULL_37_14]|nr:MAG: 16S rRNA (cytosine(1402)-N(4))-methyltransferase [Gammaproteobacteria bacterium RIFCSPHIGHO2_12_FULL_37_14]